ncbi:MAG: cupredoxin domain-containing protein [Deltaproteobacteria bacterium]|nr:cupredoxin domain-containing protein [Deltaproteobacteria bacterium]
MTGIGRQNNTQNEGRQTQASKNLLRWQDVDALRCKRATYEPRRRQSTGHRHPKYSLDSASDQTVLGSTMSFAALIFAAVVAASSTHLPGHKAKEAERYFLPDASADKIVSVARSEAATSGMTVLTQAIAIKETGPKKTVARFGEVYSFSPTFIAVQRDEPTAISFWNLQGDDVHDFMLVDPDLNALMKVELPPLQKTSFTFSFHREGLFNFYCTMHQPEMSGQILVLPPAVHTER